MKKENVLRYFIHFLVIALAAAAFICDSPKAVFEGIKRIFLSESVLITDYFVVGGVGASLLNAAIVLAVCDVIVLVEKIPFTGITMAALFINLGYGLWGKNPLNILPIICGVWIYAALHHARLGRHIYTALFGTCLAPFVTQLCYLLPFSAVLRVTAAVATGITIGYLLPPITMHTPSVHMGYNLFNGGFSGGILAFVVMSVLRSIGIESESVLLWQAGRPPAIVIGLYLFFAAVFFLGLWCGGRAGGLKKLMSRPGRVVTDFVLMDGAGAAMMNMGLVGAVSTTYILLIGGDFSGPVVGSILVAFGFAGFGAHLKNYIPVLLGVYLFTYISRYEPTTPGIQLAALFCVGVAPIAGQFGVIAGILAGMLHSAIVMCTAGMYGGLNLYNNGFSAGWVAMFMVPTLESFIKRYKTKEKRETRKEGHKGNDA